MVMNAILTMSSFIFPIITFPYVARILHASGTGKIDFATSVISYFGMFARLGIPSYGIKAVAKVRDDKEKLTKLVHELTIINLFMCLITYAVFAVSLLVVPKFRSMKALLIIISSIMFLNAIGIDWMYRGLEKYTYITTRSVLFKLIGLISMFMLVKNEEDYLIYGAITIFATSASDILNFINARKYISFKPRRDYDFRQHIKPVLIFFSMSVATTIYTNLDKVMLGFMKDDVAVGYYGAAVKIKNILLGLVTSASTVLLPRASYYVTKGLMDDFYRILRKTMHFIVLCSVPICIYFIIFADEGITLLSGTEYGGAIVPMMILMPTLILIGITNVSGIQMMVPLGMEKQVLYSEIIGAVIDLVLNALLIPKFAVVGAAIGTLAAEIGVTIYQMYAIKNQPVKLFSEVKWMQLIPASIIPVILVIWVKLIHFDAIPEVVSFVRLAISASIFFAAYLIIMLVVKENLVTEIWGQIISKIRKKNS
jgi:Membrane protein involved in the export of O-antigen and teichoic acid